jgi:hypothetical protein
LLRSGNRGLETIARFSNRQSLCMTFSLASPGILKAQRCFVDAHLS